MSVISEEDNPIPAQTLDVIEETVSFFVSMRWLIQPSISLLNLNPACCAPPANSIVFRRVARTRADQSVQWNRLPVPSIPNGCRWYELFSPSLYGFYLFSPFF